LRGRCEERDFFIDNLLVRIHFIIEMIWWTGLAPWEFESPFPGSLTYTFLVTARQVRTLTSDHVLQGYLAPKKPPHPTVGLYLGPYGGPKGGGGFL